MGDHDGNLRNAGWPVNLFAAVHGQSFHSHGALKVSRSTAEGVRVSSASMNDHGIDPLFANHLPFLASATDPAFQLKGPSIALLLYTSVDDARQGYCFLALQAHAGSYAEHYRSQLWRRP
jgi:hypothetical protein